MLRLAVSGDPEGMQLDAVPGQHREDAIAARRELRMSCAAAPGRDDLPRLTLAEAGQHDLLVVARPRDLGYAVEQEVARIPGHQREQVDHREAGAALASGEAGAAADRGVVDARGRGRGVEPDDHQMAASTEPGACQAVPVAAVAGEHGLSLAALSLAALSDPGPAHRVTACGWCRWMQQRFRAFIRETHAIPGPVLMTVQEQLQSQGMLRVGCTM